MSPADKARCGWRRSRCDWRCSRCGHDVREFPDRQWRHERLHSSSNVVPDCPGEVTAWCPVHGGTPDNQGGDNCTKVEGPGSRRHRQIEVIAGTIAAMTRGDDLADGLAQARAINAGGGWTIEVRYGHESPGNWTRTEGIRLNERDLDTAIDWARRLNAGENPEGWQLPAEEVAQ